MFAYKAVQYYLLGNSEVSV